MQIKKVFIVGSGLMGSGIAQVCASAGLDVTICDSNPAALEKALKSIAWSVGKLVEKGKVAGTVEEIMARIATASDVSQCGGHDLVIEAVFENLELKRQIFKAMDAAANANALLASNTSAISISELAAVTQRPAQVLGLHFFSPVPMMAAVEVVRGMFTPDAVMEAGRAFALAIGKEPIMVQKDVPGFLINRINFPATLEAMRLVEMGVATVEDVDKGLRLASGRKMGIFETGDMVGLEVTHGALLAIYEETKDPRWFPPAILRRKIAAGHVGKKAGKGWYLYDEQGNKLGMNN
ncbi:MAG: 3-hydroxyacyl-CoA dehydrogenase family protein [Desulfarculus sp.]|nr:3-hydroxyacyl-CoA dehydrogenase family protein [Desulfarculus sp.]